MLPSNIRLFPHQVQHTESIWKALSRDGEMTFLDTSRTGLGKTHVSLEIAHRLQKLYKLKVAIVAPNKQSLLNDDGWLYWAKKYEIVLERATTYSELRNKHDEWLYKDDTNKKKGYHASPAFNSLAQNGIFIIFDEFHMATRESSTHYACSALIRACYRNYTRCRVALLSLTPGDKIEHYIQICRLAGLIRNPKLYKYNRSIKEYDWIKYGFGEMVNSCIARGVPLGTLTNDFGRLSAGRIKYLVGYFYETYIKDRICFAMPIPKNENKVITKNCFLECYSNDLKNLNSAIDRLCDGVNWNGYSVDEKKDWNLGQINIALRLIERYKLRTIAKYIKEKSEKEPSKKFIVSMGSRDVKHFTYMKEILSSMQVTVPYGVQIMLEKARHDSKNVWSKINKDIFGVIMNKAYKPKVDIMSGETPVNKRIKILRQFQSSDSDCWCLLISPGVGDKSLSLHDTHGDHPREIIIPPDFHSTRINQSTGRIDRIGVMSDVEISIVYCKEARLETSIIRSMIAKSVIAENMLATGQVHKFPGKYDVWVDKDQDDKIKNEILANW